jgi:apolipoprotein N-acyltransferase
MASFSFGAKPREALGALGAGLLGAAAFPPLSLWPLILVAQGLFLWLLRDRTPTEARNLGLLYGLAFAGGTMFWLFGVFGLLAVSLLALTAAYWGLLATLVALTRGQRPLARAALAALFAVALEWLRGDAWYLRFPWYTAPHALAAWPPAVALLRWVGVYGLSLLIWFLTAWGVYGPKPVWGAVLLLPASWWLLPPAGAPDRRALLVQVERPHDPREVLKLVPAEPVDVAVLPEYAYTDPPRSVLEQEQANGPAALARRVSAPVVFGAVEGNYWRGGFENVAAVIAADGELLGTFPKQRPVPLFNDGTPGTRRPVFPVEGGVLGVGVCFDFDAPEVAAALVGQGATVLVDPTFDALSWSSVQHRQHELLLRLRAIENDRWILRAASSGRTEAIDPLGVPSAEGIAIGDTGFVTVGFAHRTGRPLGGQAHLLGPASACGTLLFLVVWGLSRWRSRRVPKPSAEANQAPTPAGA